MPGPNVLALPGQERLAEGLARTLGAAWSPVEVRRFPDGESHVRLVRPPLGGSAVVACTLDRPDERLVPLVLAARAARDAGAHRVVLAAPYLAYLRQDAVFEPGDAVSSRAFGGLLSAAFDGVVAVEPHLHRHASLGEVLAVPSRAVSLAPALAAFVRERVRRPVIVGPDAESEQWVAAVAAELAAPHAAFRKVRRGDRDVSVDVRADLLPAGCEPVLVDDIASTGRTLVEAARGLKRAGRPAALALAVHAVLAGDPRAELAAEGVDRLATSTTIPHETNAVDACPALAEGVASLLRELTAPPSGGGASTS